VLDTYSITTQPQNDRFEFFRGVVDSVFCPMQIQPNAPAARTFTGTVTVRELRTIKLAHVATSACAVRRRSQDIARLSDSGYLVKFQLAGQSLWLQRGREVHLRPGDFVICSTTEPYSLRFLEDYSMPVLALSDEQMKNLVPNPDQFLGVRMDGGDADCGLLSSFVQQVVARMGQMAEPLLMRVEANILDLLGAVLSTRAASKLKSPEEQRRRIKAYIDQHLKDHRLSPAQIAAELDISVRYAHSLFKNESLTIGQYIRCVRARACREELEREPPGCSSLTELALKWGYYDLSHMSRSFREEFRVSPKEIRARARATPLPGEPDA
jgi:AraC-like DNA-binding protein